MLSGQPDASSAGPPSSQPDSITQFGEEEADSPEQTSQDGEGVHPQAAGVSDPQPPVVAGEAVVAQPNPSSSSELFPSTAIKHIDTTVDTVPMPDCKDGNAVEAAAPEAEDSCYPLEHPAQHTAHLTTSTLSSDSLPDSGSSVVYCTDKGDVAAGDASGSEQLEAEAAVVAPPLRPPQKLSVPLPTTLVPANVAPAPVALVPVAISGAASDQGHRSYDRSASPAGSGSQANEVEKIDGLHVTAQAVDMTLAGASQMIDGWGEAAAAVDEPSLWISVGTAGSSFKGNKRCWRTQAKVSCTAQHHCKGFRVYPCSPCFLDKAPSLFKPARMQGLDVSDRLATQECVSCMTGCKPFLSLCGAC